MNDNGNLGVASVRSLQDELAELWNECRRPNWDGAAAIAVQQRTMNAARDFLQALPADLPSPTLGSEPDGSLTLDWHHSHRRTLSVSVDAESRLHFAALLDDERAWGDVSFKGVIPERVLGLIRAVRAS